MFGLVVSIKLKYKPNIRRMSKETREVDVEPCIFKHCGTGLTQLKKGAITSLHYRVSVCPLIQTRLTPIMSVSPPFLVILTFFFLKATYQNAAVSQGP